VNEVDAFLGVETSGGDFGSQVVNAISYDDLCIGHDNTELLKHVIKVPACLED
jgi:hypothetical protein